MLRSVLALAALVALAAPTPAQDRPVQLGVAVGGAVPTLGMAGGYGLGPWAAVSAETGRGRRLGFRAEVGASWNPGRVGLGPYADPEPPDVATVSALGSLVVRSGGRGYGLVGVGGHRQRLSNGHDPYGWVPGVHLGVGLAVEAFGVTLAPEAQAHLVLSDLTSGQGFTPSLVVPVSVGVRF